MGQRKTGLAFRMCCTDILVVKPENEEIEQYLIPFVADLVPVVDIKHRRVIVKPIEGLFDEV